MGFGDSQRRTTAASSRKAADRLQNKHRAQVRRERQQDRDENKHGGRRKQHPPDAQESAEVDRKGTHEHEGHVVGGRNPGGFVNSKSKSAAKVGKTDADQTCAQGRDASTEKHTEGPDIDIRRDRESRLDEWRRWSGARSRSHGVVLIVAITDIPGRSCSVKACLCSSTVLTRIRCVRLVKL